MQRTHLLPYLVLLILALILAHLLPSCSFLGILIIPLVLILLLSLHWYFRQHVVVVRCELN